MISKSEKKELDYRQVISTTTQTHVLTVPRGESFKVVLCDGTEVWLNANSNFVYPTAFIGDERIVTLEGEAYFKVVRFDCLIAVCLIQSFLRYLFAE